MFRAVSGGISAGTEPWRDFIREQIKFYRDMDLDFLKISCDGYFGWPEKTLINLESARQLYEMKPIGKDHPLYGSRSSGRKAIVRELKGECCIFTPCSVRCLILRLEVGWDKMMECMREDRMRSATPVIS